MRPIQGYGPIDVIEMASSSDYHSMQVSACRRFARNFRFGAAWTWSKTMDLNDNDTDTVTTIVNLRSWNYGLAAFDRTHIVKINYLYDLPKLPGNNIVITTVLNGWQLSGITSFVSGQPLGVSFGTTNAEDITGTSDLTPRTVIVGNAVLPKDQRTFNRFFNTSAFALPAVGTVGDAGKAVIRGPGVNNNIVERMELRLRLEAYNAFNHTQFSTVNTSAHPSTGAQTNAAFGQHDRDAKPSRSATRRPRLILREGLPGAHEGTHELSFDKIAVCISKHRCRLTANGLPRDMDGRRVCRCD